MNLSSEKWFIFLFLILFTACGKLEGEFAFKTALEDSYKKIEGQPEFEKEQKISWVYVFKEAAEPHKVGVFLMKKEIVWVDINTRIESISHFSKIIYGAIEGLDSGRYKLVLAEKDHVIAEKEFLIFSDADE